MISYEVRCPACGCFHDRWETFAPLSEADADHIVERLCFDCEDAMRRKQVQPRLASSRELAVASPSASWQQ